MQAENELVEDYHRCEWFVFREQCHHGPFSLFEIFIWLKTESPKDVIYFWRQGLPNWVEYEKSPLPYLFKNGEKLLNKLDAREIRPIVWKIVDYQFTESVGEKNRDITKPRVPSIFDGKKRIDDSVEKQNLVQGNTPERSFFKNKHIGYLLLIGVSLSFIIGVYNYFEKSWNQVAIPAGMKNNDYLELLKVTDASFSEKGPQFGVALTKDTNKITHIFVSTNLSRGEHFKVQMSSIRETLVGFKKLNTSIEIVNHSRIIELPLLEDHTGQLSFGYYQVSLLYKDQVRYQQKLYLGPDNKKEYKEKLNLYHEQLRMDLGFELGEMQQIVNSQAQQLEQVEKNFEDFLKDQNTDKSRATQNWLQSRRNWISFQKELETFMNLEIGKKGRNYYLQSIFAETKNVGKNLIAINSFIEKIIRQDQVESKNELEVSLQISLLKDQSQKLKTKLIEIEKYLSSEKIPWHLL